MRHSQRRAQTKLNALEIISNVYALDLAYRDSHFTYLFTYSVKLAAILKTRTERTK